MAKAKKSQKPAIRDRIKEFRRVKASELQASPRNWRTHPQSQTDALRAVFAEVGIADAVIARELPDGKLELIDGHLRTETLPDQLIPVLILDVDEDEANKLLATIDPLASLAVKDDAAFALLREQIETDSPALQKMLDDLAGAASQDEPDEPAGESVVPARFEVLVQCQGEAQQRELYDRLTAEGWTCRVLPSVK